ncbi:hypothetical protein D3C87_1887690 [compost metagenome]
MITGKQPVIWEARMMVFMIFLSFTYGVRGRDAPFTGRSTTARSLTLYEFVFEA